MTKGGNEQRDEVALALLTAELADESDVELVEWVAATTRNGCAGSGSGFRFRFLVTKFGSEQWSGRRINVICTGYLHAPAHHPILAEPRPTHLCCLTRRKLYDLDDEIHARCPNPTLERTQNWGVAARHAHI